MTKLFVAPALLLALFVFASAQAPRHKASGASATAAKTSPPVLLPSQAQIDAALKRSFGYDPSLTWTIYDIKPSAIPGLADVIVSMNKQNPIHLYVSPDSPNAIIGELIPFGPNPFEDAREKLKAADGPTLGAAKPVIEMVEFSDLECPHCKAAAPVVEKLIADFPQVRLRFQEFPLPASVHPWAMKAAEYADCAAQEKQEKQEKNDAFWKYIDTIFENQGSIAAATADDKLKEFATTAGLDAAKIAACAATPATEASVNKSLQLGRALDINSTPTTFINGRRVAGIANVPYEQLKALVQFEIDHAGR